MLSHDPKYRSLLLLVEHLVIQPARHHHIRTNPPIRPLRTYEIGQIPVVAVPEHLPESVPNPLGPRFPLADEFFLAETGSQLQGITHGIVPKCVDFDRIPVTRYDGDAVCHGIHPGEGFVGRRGPHQTVIVHGHAADTPTISRQQLFHHSAVTLPYLLLAQCPLQSLKHPEEPKRGVGGLGSRKRACKHTVPAFAHDRIEHIQTILRTSLLQRDAGQRHECLPPDLSVPGIPRQHFGPTVPAANDELPRRMSQTAQEIDLEAAGCQSLGEHHAEGGRIGNLLDRD